MVCRKIAALALLFTPVSITLLIDTEDALLVAHRVNSNALSEECDGV